MASVSTLVSNVRKLLDMNNSSEALITSSDIDALNLNDVIQGTLVNAARYIELNAPAHLVDGLAIVSGTSTQDDDISVADINGSTADTEVFPGTGGTESQVTSTTLAGTLMSNGLYKVTLDLPDDFLRILVFKLSGWERPGTIITEDDPRYALQASKYGLTGSPEAPVVAIARKANGKLKLEAYSATSITPTIDAAFYVPIRSISGTTIQISEKLQAAIEYYSAYLTCLTYGNGGLASAMLNQAMTLAQIPVQQVPQQTTNE